MSIIDIYCEKSIAFSNSASNQVDTELWMGSRHGYWYWSYMYFDLALIPRDVCLKDATIVLFKLPTNKYIRGEYEKRPNKNQYKILPLLEYVSPYTYYYEIPCVDEELEQIFKVNDELCYTEINITPILKEWIEERLENKGVLLLGEIDSKWIAYGSEQMCSTAMRPFLRVKYEQHNQRCPYLHEPEIPLPCSIKILD